MPNGGRAQARQLATNATWLAAGEFLARLLGFAISLYLARVLGALGYGAIGIAAALLNALRVVVQGGLAPAAIREVAQEPAKLARVYGQLSGLRGLIALACVGSVWLALPVLSEALDVPAALIGLYALGLFPVALTGAWALRALEKMNASAVARGTERLLVLTGVLALVRSAEDLLRVPILEAAAAAVTVSGIYLYLRRRAGSLRVRLEPASWRPLLSHGIPVTLSLALQTMFLQGDALLLGWMAGAESVGQFLVSHKLVLALTPVGLVLRQASFPETIRLISRDPARALELQARLLRITLLVFAPAVAAGFAAADPLIGRLYGDEYHVAPQVLRILLFVLPVLALNGGLRNLLLAAGLPHALPRAGGVAVAVHVGLALLLIPSWGAPGSAAACLTGECVGALLLGRVVLARLGGLPWERRVAAPLLAAALAALVLWLGESAAPWLRWGGAALVFVSVAAALGAVRRDELRLLLAHLRRDA